MRPRSILPASDLALINLHVARLDVKVSLGTDCMTFAGFTEMLYNHRRQWSMCVYTIRSRASFVGDGGLSVDHAILLVCVKDPNYGWCVR